jgi:hypothetical protein
MFFYKKKYYKIIFIYSIMQPNFVCKICAEKFKCNYLLDKHINRNVSCLYEKEIELEKKISKLTKYLKVRDKNDNIDIQCLYCKNNFSTKGNLKIHISNHCSKRKHKYKLLQKSCDELSNIKNKIKDQELYETETETETETDINNFKSTNNLDQEQLNNINNLDRESLIKLLLEKQQVINNTNSNNNNNNTNTIQNINNQQNITNVQITLNNYDKPNCDFLTIEQKNKFLKDRYKGLLDFITYVYFNEAYPENHTILYTNLRSKYGQIYKNNKWMIEEIDEIADKLNEYSFDKLSEHLDEIKNDENAEKYKKDIDKGIAFINYFTTNDTSKQTKSDIKKTLYNNKDLIEKTKKNI